MSAYPKFHAGGGGVIVEFNNERFGKILHKYDLYKSSVAKKTLGDEAFIVIDGNQYSVNPDKIDSVFNSIIAARDGK